jgi:uncharacterized membrane protein YjgN (DUF898 family)
MRYFYGSTEFDGHRFEYLADPIKVLKGRIVALVVLIAYYFAWDVAPDFGVALFASFRLYSCYS